jgi:hypothetical protein
MPAPRELRSTGAAESVGQTNFGTTSLAPPNAVQHKSCCRAIKTRATKRSIAFLLAEAGPLDTLGFSQCWARAFDGGQRMVELWNNWYQTLASAEALATVIVFVVVGAGVIMLAQGRRR